MSDAAPLEFCPRGFKPCATTSWGSNICAHCGFDVVKHSVHVRPTWDEHFMEKAHVVAKMSTCPRALKYGGIGAVLVRDHRELSSGFTGSIRRDPHCIGGSCVMETYDGHECAGSYCKFCHRGAAQAQCERNPGAGCIIDPAHGGCVRTCHAELNAVLNAASHGIKIEGSTAYITMSPCWDCFKALANGGVVRVLYGAEYRLGVERQAEFAKRLGIEFERL